MEREADQIKPSIEAILPESIDVESIGRSSRCRNRLISEIHCELVSLCADYFCHYGQHFVSLQNDQQDPVLETVIVENVGEAGCDHATETMIEQGPGRMLTR